MKRSQCMWKKRILTLLVVGGAASVLSLPAFSAGRKAKVAPRKDDGRATCYQCHEDVKALKESSKHAKLACETCHEKLKEHLADSDRKPTTKIDSALCG